jgi:hypothetical protein
MRVERLAVPWLCEQCNCGVCTGWHCNLWTCKSAMSLRQSAHHVGVNALNILGKRICERVLVHLCLPRRSTASACVHQAQHA